MPRSRRTLADPTDRRGRAGSAGLPITGARRSRQYRPMSPTTSEARHAGGASPVTVRTARADVAKVHQVLRARRSHGGWSVRDVLHAIGRDGRNRGRGQVAGIGWAHAEAAASLASNGGAGLQGLREAAIIRVMSDTLARVSEVAALQVVTWNQTPPAAERYSSAPRSPISRARAARATSGRPRWGRAALPRSCRAFCRAVVSARSAAAATPAPRRWAPTSIRTIVRRRAAAIDGIAGRIGGHSLRVGSALEFAAAGASVPELQQAGGWKSPTTPGVYIRREAAARGPMARRRYKVGGSAVSFQGAKPYGVPIMIHRPVWIRSSCWSCRIRPSLRPRRHRSSTFRWTKPRSRQPRGSWFPKPQFLLPRPCPPRCRIW